MKKILLLIPIALILAALSGCIGGDDMAIYHITNLAELQAITPGHLADDCILDNDIDATATVGWNGGLGFDPIGDWFPGVPFTGSFDGQNHSITNLYINRPGELVGLFGHIQTSVNIRDVTLLDVNFRGGSDPGGFHIGGLAGQIGGLAAAPHGDITNCHVTGSVRPGALGAMYAGGLAGWCGQTDVSGCSFVGTVEGTDAAGGLFARAVHANVSQSSAVADVTQVTWAFTCGGLIGFVYGDSAITECWSGGSVQGGGSALGGLIGQVRDTLGNPSVSDCYSTAQVSATAGGIVGGLIGWLRNSPMARCYSTGTVSSAGAEGGLVAAVEGTATVVNSFWDTESSGEAASAGGTGRTTAQMNTQFTFTDADWGFDAVWSICNPPQPSYPWLQWQNIQCLGVIISLIG